MMELWGMADRKIYLLAVAFLSISLSQSAQAGWLFGPSNYDECIREHMKGVSSDYAAEKIAGSCSRQFSRKPKSIPKKGFSGHPWITSIDPTDLHYPYRTMVEQNAIGDTIAGWLHRLDIVERQSNSLTVMNRNSFGVSGVKLGKLKPNPDTRCSPSLDDYEFIDNCTGSASANSTGRFSCPNLNNTHPVCVVGLKRKIHCDDKKECKKIMMGIE